jgi:rod shape determining protein RodA
MWRFTRFHPGKLQKSGIAASLDPLIIVSVLVLGALSLLILFSIKLPDTAQHLQFNPYQQVGFVVGGLVVLFGLSRLDYRIFKKWSVWAYLGSVILLILVWRLGDSAGGAQRWLDVAGLRFQPAELAKVSLILLLGRIFSHSAPSRQLQQFLRSIIYLAIPVFLIAIQPDLSSALICVVIWFTIASGSSVPKRILAMSGILVLSLSLLSLPLLADYQRERLVTFLQPGQDALDSGYNSQQALITVGSGGMWGQGLSGGSQSQLLFLPEQHTDFIFAVVAEKLGFAGVIIVLAAYSCLVLGILRQISRTRDAFGRYVLMGVSGLLGLQILINVGMNIGLLPVTGLPLPFMSYGGTHTIISYGLLGIVLNIARQVRNLTYKKKRGVRLPAI